MVWRASGESSPCTEKDKVRVLSRGDKQQLDMLGETSGPVCRVMSIFLLTCIAIKKDYIMFKMISWPYF
jgi:hypothetical protein